jgi:uncharacterized protein YjbI with pentapeptide repeats
MRNVSLRLLATGVAVALTVAVGAAFATPENVERLKTTGSCAGCDLFGENLSAIQAPGADLSQANLGEALFYGANLEGANFTGASLDGANFKLANLRGATGMVFHNTATDERTTCPDGSNGPCAE